MLNDYNDALNITVVVPRPGEIINEHIDTAAILIRRDNGDNTCNLGQRFLYLRCVPEQFKFCRAYLVRVK